MLNTYLRPSGGYVTLSEVRRQFDLTARAVRFYEDIGLIESNRDRRNCRRYDWRARSRLELIAQFRRAGLPLETIREILSHQDEPDCASYVECAIDKLTDRIQALDEERRRAELVLKALTADRQARPASRVDSLAANRFDRNIDTQPFNEPAGREAR